jgi:hypothetical protein
VLFLNAALNVAKLYFDRKDRGRIVEATQCNMLPGDVANLRAAVERQPSIARDARDDARKAEDRHERALDKLALSMDRLTDKLNEVLVDSRATRRRHEQ